MIHRDLDTGKQHPVWALKESMDAAGWTVIEEKDAARGLVFQRRQKLYGFGIFWRSGKVEVRFGSWRRTRPKETEEWVAK